MILTTGPVARLLAWTCVAAILALSLVPGAERPHTSLPGRAEHFLAYAATGFFFAMGYGSARLRVSAWLGLTFASGAYEILQSFVPGRSPSAADALASVAGLTIGLVSGVFVAAVLPRVGRSEPADERR